MLFSGYTLGNMTMQNTFCVRTATYLFLLQWVYLLICYIPVTSWATSETFDANMVKQLLKLELKDLFEVPVVSVASGKAEPINIAPAVTSVITAQDIEAMGATNLDEVLNTIPGVRVVRSRVFDGSTYIIRGVAPTGLQLSNEVLFMVNGMPYRRLINGSYSGVRKGIPLQAVQRIEVIRGPGSALYGADALAGVVNIITKTAEDIDGLEVSGRVGSFDTYHAGLLYGDDALPVKTAFSLEYTTTDGHGALITEDFQTRSDQQFGTHASYAPGRYNNTYKLLGSHLDLAYQQWHLHLNYLGLRDAGTGGGVSGALDPSGRVEWDNWRLDLDWTSPRIAEHWQFRSHLNLEYNDIAYWDVFILPPGALGGALPKGNMFRLTIEDHVIRLGLEGDYTGFNKHVLRVGIGYVYADIIKTTNEGIGLGLDGNGNPIDPNGSLVDVTDTPFESTPETLRNNWYAFVQDSWQLAKHWQLTVGVRYDHYDDFGSTTNPRAALVWQTTPTFTSKLLYGSAFRAPAHNEMFIQNNFTLTGNPNLQPEQIDTWELAFNWQARKQLNFAFNLYHYRLTDRVVQVAIDPTLTVLQIRNQETWKGRGFEFETHWKASQQSSLLFNYAYAKTTEKSGADVGRYPQHQAYLRYDQLLYPNWSLNTQINWIASRKRQPEDNRPAVDDYHTFDLTLRYKDMAHPRWNIAIGVRNVLDETVIEPTDASLPNDLPQAERNYFLEVRYKFAEAQ